MNSLHPFLHFTTIIFFLHLLHQSPVSCSNPQGLLIDKKTRLGSRPPSCHNKCNECHPCMAIQVPTEVSHSRVEQSLSKKAIPMEEDLDPIPSNNRYSNYKPLGWKCRCRNKLFNP